MGRVAVNRTADMEGFVQVVQLGSFSGAARAMRMTPSAVSKLISRLEARLGVRLLQRSTRSFQLTAEGRTFFERSTALLEELDAVEQEVARGAEPRGRVRINCNVPFGQHVLLPALPDFLARHPQVTVDVTLTDAVVDPIAVRADVAIRTGPLRASSLVARRLGESRMVVVASPAYLARAGRPKKPADLERHNRLGFTFQRHIEGWPFRVARGDKRVELVPLAGNAFVGDGESMMVLALAGLGIARMLHFQVAEAIAEKKLVRILEAYEPGDTEPVHAILVGPRNQIPSRVRAFVDWLAPIMDAMSTSGT